MADKLSIKEGATAEQCPKEDDKSCFVMGRHGHNRSGNKVYYEEAKKLVEAEVVSWEKAKGKTSKRLTENLITHMNKNEVRFLVKREDGFYYEVLQDNKVFFSLVRKIITDFRKGKEKELADIAANETSKIMEAGGDIIINNDSDISLPGIGGNDTPSEVSYVCNIVMNYYVISLTSKYITTYTSPITFYQGS